MPTRTGVSHMKRVALVTVKSQKCNSSNCCHFRHKRNNINTHFDRFKNQGRHTVHSHVLVWIKQLQKISQERIEATVPLDKLFWLI